MSYWFRPKYYGYGATPSNWKGWIATLALVVALLAVNVSPLPTLIRGLLGVIALGLFAWIAWKKTDGPWRWRWGSRAERNQRM